MENITEYVDHIISMLEPIHSEVVFDFRLISKYKLEGFKYVKESKLISQNGTTIHIYIPTDNEPTGYVIDNVIHYIHVIDFKGVKYYGVDVDSYKGRPNLAILFNKSIPETKGIKWTKSVDNIKTYISHVLEKYNKSYSLNTIPSSPEDILLYQYFTDDFLTIHFQDIKLLINNYYKDKWIEVKNTYIDYQISQKEKHIKELENEINRINSEIDNAKANIEDLKNSKIQIEAE